MNNKSKVAIWIVVGAAAGIAFGALTQRTGLFTGVGVAIGAAIGLALTRESRK